MRSGIKSHEKAMPVAILLPVSFFFRFGRPKVAKRASTQRCRGPHFGRFWAPKLVLDAVVFGSSFRTSICMVSGHLLDLMWELLASFSAHVPGKGGTSKK